MEEVDITFEENLRRENLNDLFWVSKSSSSRIIQSSTRELLLYGILSRLAGQTLHLIS